MDPVPFAGAVLTGGRSSRMGTDKAVVQVDGVAMAVRVGRALEEAGAASVLTVGGDDRELGWSHVPDAHPGEGPLGGVITALTAADADIVLVTACDLPWLDASTLASLIDALGDGDVAMARSDRREPLCAAWRRTTALPALQAAFAAGERAVHRALEGLAVVDVQVDAAPLTNVNTPADLAR